MIPNEVYWRNQAQVYDIMICSGVDLYEFSPHWAHSFPIEGVVNSGKALEEIEDILRVFKKHGYNFSFLLKKNRTLLESCLENKYSSHETRAIHFLLSETDYLLHNPDVIHLLADRELSSTNLEWIQICLEKGQRFWDENCLTDPSRAFEILCRIGNVSVLEEWPDSFPMSVPFEWILESTKPCGDVPVFQK